MDLFRRRHARVRREGGPEQPPRQPRYDAQLVRADGQLLCDVEVAATARTRGRGLLGRTSLEGALWLRPCRSVHTLGMSMTIDVAFLDRDCRVVDALTLAPGRFPLPRWRARSVLEVAEGRLAEWGVAVGDALAVIAPGEPAAPGTTPGRRSGRRRGPRSPHR